MSAESVKDPGPLQVSSKTKGIFVVMMFLGFLAFVFTLYKDPSRAWHSYLNGFFYVMSLSLGGLFFTAIQHASKAGWSVNVRRISESFMAFIPLGFLLGVVYLFGAQKIYNWLDPAIVAKDELLQHKSAYLNQTFFWIRFVGFFVLWFVLSKLLTFHSVAQDKTGDESHTHKNLTISIIALVVFALSYSFFSVDTIMALEAHWFSTIFGVYAFAGLFQSTIALMILILLRLIEKGQLKGIVTMDHMHDLGKFLFAFTVFWAYIAFSQFMLIWYANLPEESFFFVPRSTGGWAWVSVALILFKFVVPFFALLPRWAKRTPGHLTAVCYLILIMQYIDIFWVVYPHFNEHHVVLGIPEVLMFLGFFGAFMWAITRFLSRHSVIPLRDPRAHESHHHHVVY